MNATEFCYWLRGYFELHEKGVRIDGGMQLTTEQVHMISEHLKSVFDHVIMNPPEVRLTDGITWGAEQTSGGHKCPIKMTQPPDITRTIITC